VLWVPRSREAQHKTKTPRLVYGSPAICCVVLEKENKVLRAISVPSALRGLCLPPERPSTRANSKGKRQGRKEEEGSNPTRRHTRCGLACKMCRKAQRKIAEGRNFKEQRRRSCQVCKSCPPQTVPNLINQAGCICDTYSQVKNHKRPHARVSCIFQTPACSLKWVPADLLSPPHVLVGRCFPNKFQGPLGYDLMNLRMREVNRGVRVVGLSTSYATTATSPLVITRGLTRKVGRKQRGVCSNLL